VASGLSSVVHKMPYLKSTFLLFKDAFLAFRNDQASIYAAGLAYYMVFSVAPLLVFVISIAGFFIDRTLAEEQVTSQLQYLMGGESADYIDGIVTTLRNQTLSQTVTIVSIVALLISGAGIFGQLRTALNLIWGITNVRPVNVREWLLLARYRAIPFLSVFLLGTALALAVIAETALSTVEVRFEALFPDAYLLLPQLGRLIIPGLTFVAFLLVFVVLPDAQIRWRDAAVGAAVTAVLFLIGRIVLAIFLALGNTGSIYGAAGSLIILLLWIYYSAQLLLYGAEFTRLYALRHGQAIRPNRLSRMMAAERDQ